MPIVVVCPSCRKSISAPPEYVGRAIKCPGCSTKTTVPDPSFQEMEIPEVKKPVKPVTPPVDPVYSFHKSFRNYSYNLVTLVVILLVTNFVSCYNVMELNDRFDHFCRALDSIRASSR